MIETAVVMVFVVAVLAFVAYALVRPFTHVHYDRSSGRLWRPLGRTHAPVLLDSWERRTATPGLPSRPI